MKGNGLEFMPLSKNTYQEEKGRTHLWWLPNCPRYGHFEQKSKVKENKYSDSLVVTRAI